MRELKPILIIVTESFPWCDAAEATFIQPEITFLAESFDIILLPGVGSGHPVTTQSGVLVKYDRPLRSTRNLMRNLLVAATAGWVWKESLIALCRLRGGWKALRRALSWACGAIAIRRMLCSIIAEIDPKREVVVYAYWLNAAALGAALLPMRPNVVKIARGHGFDVYRERLNPPYHPFRSYTLGRLDRCYIVSRHGQEALARNYPQYGSKIDHAPIGIMGSGHPAQGSWDGIFRLVSCAACVPVKRLHLLVQALAIAAQRVHGSRWIWHHFGGGPLLDELRTAASHLPSSVESHLVGAVSNEKVLDHYARESIDLFVLVSESEGRPVSIMEAMACSIPVLTTEVGGVPELVDQQTGTLLSKDATAEQIADAIIRLRENPSLLRRQGAAGQVKWQNCASADFLSRQFSRSIQSLLLSGKARR